MSKPNWFLSISKPMFPACASYGPVFIAMGFLYLKNHSIIAAIVPVIGAFTTSWALIYLHKKQLELEAKIQDLPHRDSSD